MRGLGKFRHGWQSRCHRALQQRLVHTHVESVLPIVDISSFTSEHGSVADRTRVLKEVSKSCESIGFMVISGHGVSVDVQRNMMEASRAFFALDLSEKLSLNAHSENPAYRGYIPVEGENVGKVFGNDPTALPDPVEKFCVGNPRLNVLKMKHPQWFAETESQAYAENVWPDGLPGFREAVEEYYAEVEKLAHCMMGIFAQSLDLPPAFFSHGFAKGGETLLRCLHYPAVHATSPHRLHAHTDGTLLTILMQDLSGGLEVLINDEWRSVPAVPNTFVVNIGDLMMFWSNRRWRSTWHRVNGAGDATSNTERSSGRLSFPLFFTPDADTVVECHPSFLKAGESSAYSLVTVGDYNRLRMKDVYLQSKEPSEA
eukprot:TRINITY_DN28042_c0_g1_i1.p1 TRINITY_DN28042_c0_g1~~TRINITY_DN28042_c0_g1_i1.p1  ORF type:complete len:371 (-),score=27.20 TRINITY_DN28042_c0_g1_i1:309-1421(-)